MKQLSTLPSICKCETDCILEKAILWCLANILNSYFVKFVTMLKCHIYNLNRDYIFVLSDWVCLPLYPIYKQPNDVYNICMNSILSFHHSWKHTVLTFKISVFFEVQLYRIFHLPSIQRAPRYWRSYKASK